MEPYKVPCYCKDHANQGFVNQGPPVVCSETEFKHLPMRKIKLVTYSQQYFSVEND